VVGEVGAIFVMKKKLGRQLNKTNLVEVPPGFEPRLAEISLMIRIRCDNQLHYGTGDITIKVINFYIYSYRYLISFVSLATIVCYMQVYYVH
jgi:hypothetical protein